MAGNKPWDQRPIGRRTAEIRERRRVLIVCEDTKSACDYFKAFPIDPQRAEVVPVGTGMNTDSLVEEALRLKKVADHIGQPYSEIWCAFDRDSFPAPNYNRAFELARANNIKVAWANEAFELWYLLHFNYHDTGINRKDYKAKLKRCGLEYDKSDDTIYGKLIDRQATAMKYARKLERYNNDMPVKFPERLNPSTGVHKLVEVLNELAELGATN
jgi:RloB-like protein